MLGGVAAGVYLVVINKVSFTSVHKGAIKHANALTKLKVLAHITILSKVKCDDGRHENTSWATEPCVTTPAC